MPKEKIAFGMVRIVAGLVVVLLCQAAFPFRVTAEVTAQKASDYRFEDDKSIPLDARLYCTSGIHWMNRGDLNKAFEYLKKAISIYPDFPIAKQKLQEAEKSRGGKSKGVGGTSGQEGGDEYGIAIARDEYLRDHPEVDPANVKVSDLGTMVPARGGKAARFVPFKVTQSTRPADYAISGQGGQGGGLNMRGGGLVRAHKVSDEQIRMERKSLESKIERAEERARLDKSHAKTEREWVARIQEKLRALDSDPDQYFYEESRRPPTPTVSVVNASPPIVHIPPPIVNVWR